MLPLLLFVGCHLGEDSAPVDTAADFCKDVPLLTYQNFGAGFMTENCQGCHAGTAPNRYGAPDSVTFDNVEQCWAWKDRILARTATDDPTMPPNGGVTDDDRLRLKWWLLCAPNGS